MKILVLSGRKQAGKTTLANFISAYKLKQLDDNFDFGKNGNLLLKTEKEIDSVTQTVYGTVDLSRNDNYFVRFASDHIWPYVKTYSYADTLKTFLVQHFGLTEAQCNGTDDDKNSLTDLRWENMPGVITDEVVWQDLENQNWLTTGKLNQVLTFHKSGRMTAREVMQYFGTEVCRKISGNCWVDGTFKRILSEGSDLAIVTDCRFRNELTRPQEILKDLDVDFLTVRLNRKIEDSKHLSEVDLDKTTEKDYDLWVPEDVSMEEKNQLVLNFLAQKGWL